MTDEELWGEGWRQGHADALSDLKRDEKQALADRQEIERLRGLLRHVRAVLPSERWAEDTKRMIDAALAGATVQPAVSRDFITA